MDFSRVVTPEGTSPRSFEDQLVQWAWYNSPGNEVYKEQIKIAANNKKLTWWELLDATATFNINEGHFQKDSILNGQDMLISNPSNNLFFPRYNFGINFNIGAILSRPTRSKIADAELKIVELEEQQQMLRVRAEVLPKTQAAEEGESIYTLVLEQFENDKVDFKDYTAASSAYHGANEAKAVAQTKVNIARILLEELIGINWEKAVKRRRNREKR